MSIRVAYDPALPVITTAAFSCGDRVFKDGEPFPWRELGLTEFELRAFWQSGMVAFVPFAAPGELVAAGELRAFRTDDGGVIIARAGERVEVETPTQAKKRRGAKQPQLTE